MTSQAQAGSPLPGVRGLAFLAFPLHPAGHPADERARHLSDVSLPMLFIQGTRDELADLSLLQRVVANLAPRATLKLIQDANHSFHVAARTGRNDSQVTVEVVQDFAAWAESVIA